MPNRSLHPSPTRHLGAVLVAAVAATALVATIAIATETAAPAAAASSTPGPGAGASAAIEGPSPYLPQTDCDLTLRAGTVALMRLLQRTYPDGTDLGILQSCSAEGMTSEHADGRALDLGLNVNKPRQHAEALALLQWLFATDRFGNTQAMARRLGIMYVIYDSQIRSVGDPRSSPYLSDTCGNGRGDPSTCHRDHMHISLGWNGALGRTSYWTGRVAAVDYGPCVAPGHLFSAAYTRPNPTPCPAPPLRPLPQLTPHSRGPAVSLIQRVIGVKVDGVFGPATAQAVMTWRKGHRLKASATVDAQMWSYLNTAGQLN